MRATTTPVAAAAAAARAAAGAAASSACSAGRGTALWGFAARAAAAVAAAAYGTAASPSPPTAGANAAVAAASEKAAADAAAADAAAARGGATHESAAKKRDRGGGSAAEERSSSSSRGEGAVEEEAAAAAASAAAAEKQQQEQRNARRWRAYATSSYSPSFASSVFSNNSSSSNSSNSSNDSSSSDNSSRRNACGPSLRRALRSFFLRVHPDLTHGFPEEARRCNAAALAELNPYLDRLQLLLQQPQKAAAAIQCLRAGDEQQETCGAPLTKPYPEKKLLFFLPHTSYATAAACPAAASSSSATAAAAAAGESSCSQQRVQHAYIRLPALPLRPSPELLHHISQSVYLALKGAVEQQQQQQQRYRRLGQVFPTAASSSLFFGDADLVVEPLLSPKNSAREKLHALWGQHTEDIMFKAALYQPKDDSLIQRACAMRNAFHQYEASLIKKARRMTNSKRRKKHLAEAAAKAEEMVLRRFGRQPEEPPPQLQQHMQRVEIFEAGFHPDYIFLKKNISPQQQQEAVKRICGKYCEDEPTAWLLHHLLLQLRRPPGPIPLIITDENNSFQSFPQRGLFVIPYNFDVWTFADFLEKHLDAVRDGRRQLLADLQADYYAE